MPQTASDPKRIHGRFYSPARLVEAMLRLVSVPKAGPFRILDPACGDGAFLRAIPAFAEAHWNRAFQAIELHGVDIDAKALSHLKSTGRARCHLVWGDALIGRGFGEPGDPIQPEVGGPPAVDWPMEFPDADGSGGFDLVIGNPPFRRERDSKAQRRRLLDSPLGRKCRQARMDLWAYFLHRGWDLLKPGGQLIFVLPSFWTAAVHARPLIEWLNQEATLRDIVRLGRLPVFDNVSGHHLILSLEKRTSRKRCRVWDATESFAQLDAVDDPGSAFVSLSKAEMFRGGQLVLAPASRVLDSMHSQRMISLGECFDVRQGIVENPRRITRNMANRFPGRFQRGEGVFVMNEEERQRANLSEEERRLLRPYFRGQDVERYQLLAEPAEFLLYLTKSTAPRIEQFPALRAHLERFRPLLEQRREVRLGRIAWWHLHWPRQESLFRGPKLLMPQMGFHPRFVFVPKPAYAGFSMHVIRDRSEHAREANLRLPALAGILNSRLAEDWFRRFAKHRGACLDISGGVLKQFPLPPPDDCRGDKLAELVQCRQNLTPASPRAGLLEENIEALVREWYGASGLD